MDSVASRQDYDYTITDADGHIGVKDGKKYPITDEEWQKAYPEHRNTDCKECTFVLDVETILAFHVPKNERDKAIPEPKFIGKFTMSGWSGHSSFYLFQCKYDGTVVVDYPHGYTPLGSCYLRCACGTKVILKKKEDYERDNMHVSPVALGFRENYKNNLKMFEELEKSKPMNVQSIGTDVPSKTLKERIGSFFRLKP